MKKLIIFSFLILLCLSLGGCDWFETTVEAQGSNIISITTEEMFKKNVLENKKPVIVKFETNWCGACKAMAPIYAKLANELKGKVVFTNLNADDKDVAKIANEHEIRGVPTFKFFKDGKVVGEIVGGMSEAKFKAKIKEILNLK